MIVPPLGAEEIAGGKTDNFADLNGVDKIIATTEIENMSERAITAESTVDAFGISVKGSRTSLWLWRLNLHPQ